ncbi:MAG: CYTH domain-containing protein [Candidatus Sungbacteria bacterium]|nr:CYTH domain-containing protein [Candidatus Sungbacteria bacterium]
MEEIEVKFLNIKKEEIERKLKSIGASKVGDFFYRRQVFDYPDFRLDKEAAWIRLRDEGNRITLGFKQRIGRQEDGLRGDDAGMHEIEFEVSNFDLTAEFLYKLGLVNKFYFENRRVRYMKDGVEFDIDEWPLLEPYLEIEAPSWGKVDEAINWLGLKKEDLKKFSTTQVYALKGINDKDYTKLTFDEAVKRV